MEDGERVENQREVSTYHGCMCDSICIECLKGIDVASETNSCNSSSCVTLPCQRSCECATELGGAPANHVPAPPSDVRVVMSDITEEGVIVKVTWIPSPDLPCLYDIFAFSNESLKLISEETQGKFEATLSLNFDHVYNISVRAHDSFRVKESNATWVQFQSPSCLEAHHYDLSICRPEAPVIKVREKELPEWQDGLKLYDVLVSWSRPKVDPYYYVATVVVVRPPHAVYKVNATRTATNVTVHRIRLPERYFATVRACAARGCTESRTVSRTWDGNNTIVKVDADSEDWAKTFTIWVPAISSVLIVGVILLLLLLRKIRVQKENFERERNTQTDSAVVPYVVCNDEWEVEMSRLTFGPKLGEGAFGVVNRGFLKLEEGCDNGRNVAIKCLKSDAGQDEIRSFLREMELMKCVGAHPNIVSLLGCCTRPSQLVLVVEYCMHGDLQQYLRSGMEETLYFDPAPHLCGSSLPLYSHCCVQKPSAELHKGYVNMSSAVENRMYMAGFEVPCTTVITEEPVSPPAFLGLDAPTLLSFARQAALGMEFLSRNRVVHRDLAARNVLVGCDLAIKIADFGLSRDVYEQNVYKKKGGGRLPVKWMALESLFLQMYTTKSDVWSFGVLLWEIATLGGNPFPSLSGKKVIEVLKAGHRLECPASCSAHLYQLMRDCWNSNPRKRPTFAEIRTRLDRMLESPSVREHIALEHLNDHRSCVALRSDSEGEISVTLD